VTAAPGSPWRKHGRVFPDGPPARGFRGFAALPFAEPVRGGRCRVWYSDRDAENRSHIFACTLDLDSLAVVPGSRSAAPLLSPGPAGAFDEDGCSMSCAVADGSSVYLYYTGWKRRPGPPFGLAIGLAVSRDGGASFAKVSADPLLGEAPGVCLAASPSVLREGELWRMWYVSGVRWERVGDGWLPWYHIQYAESRDGRSWRPTGRVCIDFAAVGEHAFGRPQVVREDDGGYAMWYCHRGPSYRIGYAESSDGLAWKRRDEEAGIAPSAAGWDSEMIAYPMVIREPERSILLYNGNGYGATGFGCATRDAR
jgi:hypothetical protein